MAEIDIVIPTFNRKSSLVDCLEGLCQQSTKVFKVIVVDDASPVDIGSEICAHFENRLDVHWLRLAGNSGPATARNAGVAEGTSPLICFIDDDVVASPGLISAHRTAMQKSARPLVSIGPLRAPRGWTPTAWNRWEAETLAREYRRMLDGVYAPTWRQFFTGNAMVRRADFERVGGFDTRYKRAEDIELGYRLWRSQCEFVFNDFAIGWHYAERSLASWMRIPEMYAQADYAISRAYPELNWLERIDRERGGAAGRVSESAARMGLLGSGVRKGSVSVAQGLDKAGLHSLASPLLSMAFNIGYRQGRMGLRPDAPLHGSKPEAVANR